MMDDSIQKTPHTSVQQREQDAAQHAIIHKRRTLKDKLGLYNIVVLSLGTIAICLAVAFLAFIWTVANNNTKNGQLPPLWRQIAEAQWVPRVVTLCSIVIRVAAAAQLCVFAAVVAALILERVGASTQDLPSLSMIRCANSGPTALIWNVIHTIGNGTQVGYSILIIVTIINAMVMQFTSTLLLADLVPTRIVLGKATNEINFAMTLQNEEKEVYAGVNPYVGSDIWRTGPQSYPRFAEYRGTSASNESTFTDTGKVYRGFIPLLSANERNVLRSYTGPMTVVDTRVLCVRPTLSNITFQRVDDSDAIITGTLDIAGIHPDLSVESNRPDGGEAFNTFNCSAPQQDVTFHGTSWNASLCILGQSYGRLLHNISPEDEDDEAESPTGRASASLLINATRVDGLYGEVAERDSVFAFEQQEPSHASWAKIGNANMSFDLSICFMNPLPRDYEISAKSAADVTADLTSRVVPGTIPGTFIYDTSAVQQMMGADGLGLSPEQRQLLTIEPPNNWNASRMLNVHDTKERSYILEILNKDESEGNTWQFSPWAIPVQAMHRSHAALVLQVLSKSLNPALAIQALYTVLLESSYYDLLPVYNTKRPASYGLAQEVLIPVRWNCFVAVMAILGVHFLLILLAVILFIAKSEMSLLGNAWQAISQVMSEDTAYAVRHGAMATDDEVTDTFKNSGVANGRIRIAKCEQSGRTEARTVLHRR